MLQLQQDGYPEVMVWGFAMEHTACIIWMLQATDSTEQDQIRDMVDTSGRDWHDEPSEQIIKPGHLPTDTTLVVCLASLLSDGDMEVVGLPTTSA